MHEIFKNIPVVPDNMSIEAMIDHLGSDVSMQRGRPYSGQPHTTTGKRGEEMIRNMSFRDLRDCYIRGLILSHQVHVQGSIDPLEPNHTLVREAEKGQKAAICDNDIFTLKGDVDPIAVWQNMACEIEKLMGIFPNVEGMKLEY